MASRHTSLKTFIEYGNFLNYCEADNDRSTVTNFLEMCLVLNKVRPATIITIANPRNLNAINSETDRFSIFVYPLSLPSASESIFINTERIDESKLMRIRSYNGKGDHAFIGEILGYMTPFDIMKPGSEDKKTGSISVKVIFKEKEINVTLCPQIIINKTDDEIKSYYEPMVRVLHDLGVEMPKAKLQITQVEIMIKPHYSRPLLEIINHQFINKLNRIYDLNKLANFSILAGKYISDVAALSPANSAAAGGGGGGWATPVMRATAAAAVSGRGYGGIGGGYKHSRRYKYGKKPRRQTRRRFI